MTSLVRISGLMAVALLSSRAHAQFTEVEPNSVKTEATLVNGITNAGTITGTSTGTGVTAGDTALTTVDVYRVKTAALAPAIYLHTLTLNTTNAASIRGVTQAAGVPTPGTDAVLQTSSAATCKWYGFGKQEELYYRVDGTATTTAPYTATLTTTTVTPAAVPGTFNAGNIVVTTSGQGHTTDTEIYLYDGNLNPVPLGHNDDIINVGVGQSRISLVLAAGTYHVALANFNTANNVGDANPGENFLVGALMDFPDVLCNNSTTTNVNVACSVSDGTTTTPVAATRANAFEVAWISFTVVGTIPPPVNDNCATASTLAASNAGYMGTATNDGSATCDSGGGASRDIWYTFTDPIGVGGTLSLNTCGSSAIDTAISVYASCGGAELACNDDCSGTPCGGPSSCASVVIGVGQTVLIRVSDKGLGGTYVTLNSSFVGNPPPNDLCASAITLAGPGTYGFDTTLATTGEGLVGTCGTTGPGKNLWYAYTATLSGTLTVSTCGLITGGNSGDTEISVYAGAGCPGVAPIACNDDAGAGCSTSTLHSIVSVPTTCGAVFTIELGNFSQATTTNIVGQFSVTETGTTCASPFTSFCPGDGTGTACPCGNSGAVGNGCANSLNPNGANLTASGIASIGADTWVLSGSGVPNGPGLYFQGTAQVNAGNGVVFGDGKRCAGGTIIRLGIVTAAGNASTYPSPNPPAVNAIPISLKGLNVAGNVRNYQLWYRDSGSFCSASVFNLTNGVNMTWAP